MAIHKLYLGNFKGVAEERWVDIKPITVFVGANSSGKSSCIHALACLSQTVKVTNNARPLILDDEFANVHLGRFIEVVHTRSYQDLITLGAAIKNVHILDFDIPKEKPRVRNVDGSAVYRFKCARRTQEVHLDSSRVQVGEITYTTKREGHDHIVTRGPDTKYRMGLESAFFFDQKSLYVSKRPDLFGSAYPLIQFQLALTAELNKTHYLGPFRQGPQRKYATRGSSPTEVGPMGESTVTLLANEIVQTRSRKHINQIAKWLKQLTLAKDLDVTRLASSDMFDVSITLPDGSKFPLADLGYGLSQVLPVLTQCSFAEEESTLLFEQPEIHLHTLAARQLASVFIETAKGKNCHVIVETHSPELVKQFFQELKKGTLSKDDFVVYRVARVNGCSSICPIAVDFEDGEVDVYENWESGISIP